MKRAASATITTIFVVAAVTLAAWFVFKAFTGANLITFRTGSMAPTMPQGAVAVTLKVSADDLKIGDVITVKRVTEKLPVTHRIIEIRELADQNKHDFDQRALATAPDSQIFELTEIKNSELKEIIMQGDANATPDALPYILADAHRVVFVMAKAGTVLMLLQSPLGMAVLTLFVATLVVWAFWPARNRYRHEKI